jgi:hypothetical protein
MLSSFSSLLVLLFGSRYLPEARSDKGNVEILPIVSKPTKITELRIFPIKGMQPLNLKSAKITPAGFELDRQWLMLKRDDPSWKVPKSRGYSMTKDFKTLQIKVEIEGDFLVLSHP